MNLYSLIRPLLFSIGPETSHELVSYLIKNFSPFLDFELQNPDLQRTFHGIEFKNPIGLAAGFDKNALLINQIENLGFGFMEIGTITPKPQLGNPKPRLKRIINNQSLINQMGFNNDGLYTIAKRLEKRNKTGFVIGANIGKNESTPNEKAYEDYMECFLVLKDLVDYFTINISSPNTPNLRDLSNQDYLNKLLGSIQTINLDNKPIFLKISPDLNKQQILDIIFSCNNWKINGIVSTNTTTDHNYGYGGLSGLPLKDKSNYVSQIIRENSDLTLISSGGICSIDEGVERLKKWDLIQLYTGLIYQGPTLPKKILIKYLGLSN